MIFQKTRENSLKILKIIENFYDVFIKNKEKIESK